MSQSINTVRVRFAPSPTGFLHVGGARTALINFLFAKKYQGQFVLRSEDTDEERSRDTFLYSQLEALKWLGLDGDEGVFLDENGKLGEKGDFGPYRQTKRMPIYKKLAQKLVESGKAYYCFLTDQEIREQKRAALKNKLPFRVNSPYRNKKMDLTKPAEGAVVRFKIPDEKKNYTFKDIVRGEVSFPSNMVGDFVLLRSSGLPVYNFCCAVDDSLMKITHVFRAEEHLANTLRQLLILEALDLKTPSFGHLSLILDSDKKKLSKRSKALPCLEYKERGYLPVALNNFLALLGLSFEEGRETFDLKDLISHFSEKRLNSSPAVFDEEKLKWMNAHYVRGLSHQKFWNLLDPFLKKEEIRVSENEEWREKVFLNLKSSFSTLQSACSIIKLLSENYFEIEERSLEIKKWPETLNVLKMWKTELESFLHHKSSSHQNKKSCYMTEEEFKNIRDKIGKNLNVKSKFLFMPLRTAMIGKLSGFELNLLVSLIRVDVLLRRAKAVVEKLQQ